MEAKMNGWRVAGLVSVAALSGLALVGCGEAMSAKGADSPSYSYQGGYPQQPAATANPGWFEAPNQSPPSATGAWGDSSGAEARQAEPSARPGLGTEWGETLSSRITSTAFVRADSSSPFATSSM